jgi:hypothetical protein
MVGMILQTCRVEPAHAAMDDTDPRICIWKHVDTDCCFR